ncbi:MAG: AraC family transcriptional regulator [Oscillospiraceae bacterium]|jgi:AraC-like DNA-binding protein|nr:AraC family transcriptional regulator [Oscillospiraceae bacterium]
MSYDDLIPHVGYFVRRKTTPSWHMARNNLDAIDLSLITDGKAWYTIGRKTYEVDRGDLICIPRNVERSADTCPGDLMQCYDVNFKLTGLDGAEQTLPFPPVSRLKLYPDILDLYQKLNVAYLEKRPGGPLRVRALLMLILHRYFELLTYKDIQPTDPRIRNVMRYISEHFAENITLDDLARYARLQKAYLGVLFKESVGMSIRQYITEARITHAAGLLKNGGCTVRDASAACGFVDASYFSRVFHRVKGYPPSYCGTGDTTAPPPPPTAGGGNSGGN